MRKRCLSMDRSQPLPRCRVIVVMEPDADDPDISLQQPVLMHTDISAVD
jgi:hypothetical protein